MKIIENKMMIINARYEIKKVLNNKWKEIKLQGDTQ